jgi:hypothetical protein
MMSWYDADAFFPLSFSFLIYFLLLLLLDVIQSCEIEVLTVWLPRRYWSFLPSHICVFLCMWMGCCSSLKVSLHLNILEKFTWWTLINFRKLIFIEVNVYSFTFVLWNKMSHNLVQVNQRFRGTYPSLFRVRSKLWKNQHKADSCFKES